MDFSLSKLSIAQSFSKAANSYDNAAQFQRDVGERLLNYMPKDGGNVVVDLGCGTGFFQRLLCEKYDRPIIGVDIAEGMLSFAKHHRFAGNNQWLAADAEGLPFADSSIDLIYSSMAVQWCQQLPLLFSEIKRVLKPGGKFVFSTLVDGSLAELKLAWQSVDGYVHVNRFMSAAHWQQTIDAADLSIEGLDVSSHRLSYQKLAQLTGELKAIGAHNMNDGRRKGLMGRKTYQQLHAGYEVFRDADGKLPATYQVLYGAISNG
ncbi:MAG: malonyl-CoA O-methyltransferase [Chitinophagales bacterium]|jgi:malonyl-CoA O-methyltransferase